MIRFTFVCSGCSAGWQVEDPGLRVVRCRYCDEPAQARGRTYVHDLIPAPRVYEPPTAARITEILDHLDQARGRM